MKMSDKQKLSVTGSFYDLYKNTGKHEKYQLKLIRMLLKLYSNAYYGDQDLDNIFCETAFRDIRDGYLSNYRNHLRSYKLLKIISKEKNMLKTEKQIEEENKSCELGIALAQVAWPLNSAITSFTRSVVGLMKLRISNVKPIDSIDKLFVEIRDKVRMHTGEKAGNKEVILDGVAATKVNELLNDFRTKNLKFHKYLFLRSFGTIYDQKVYFSNKD
jgi:hypothetical protein